MLTYEPFVFVFRYLVNLGCIKPLCDLLTVMDSKIVQVALNGLENILRLGEQEAKQENNGTGVNPYCSLIEEAYGTPLTHTNTQNLYNGGLLCILTFANGYLFFNSECHNVCRHVMKEQLASVRQ